MHVLNQRVASALPALPMCAICEQTRLKPLGHDQFRCPRCSRLYDMTEDTGSPHNNPVIAAQMNESRRGSPARQFPSRFAQHRGR